MISRTSMFVYLELDQSKVSAILHNSQMQCYNRAFASSCITNSKRYSNEENLLVSSLGWN